MSQTKNQIKANISRNITTNGVGEISGEVMRNVLNNMTDNLGLQKDISDLQSNTENIQNDINSLNENKVDKVPGKGLSTEDYTTEEKQKLAGIEAGAEVNVNADWDATSGDAQILNKPDLSTYATKASVEDIEALIPSQASESNQLADKEFVNSSISTNTAEFKGTYNSLAELEAVSANENDYGFVISTDTSGNTVYNRYKYTGAVWFFEYALNNSSFTAAQWAAIQSGITSSLVTKLSALPTVTELNNSLNNKVDKVPGSTESNIAVFDGNSGVKDSEVSINTLVPVISEAFAKMQSEIDTLKARFSDYETNIKASTIDALIYKSYGKPMFLVSSVAGAPSASVVPSNWDEEEYGAWTGVPLAPNTFYTDQVNKKVYFAPIVTGSVNDWISLN